MIGRRTRRVKVIVLRPGEKVVVVCKHHRGSVS